MEIVAYGGGTNSTAMLIGLRDRNQVPSAIVFADTGGEKPETYDYLQAINSWCRQQGFPEGTVVRKGGNGETLEEELLRKKTLPPVAFGFKTCSHKYKIQPLEQWANQQPACKEIWAEGGKVTKLIGIDADEPQRATASRSLKYDNRFPLLEWDWARSECVEAIKAEGLPLPGKSSCFFCPNSKPTEILTLPKRLQERAIRLEENATVVTSVKGLGRQFSWKHLIRTNDAQACFPFAQEMPCGCYDG